ncbi:cytosol nonspecific dipeptidase [Paraphotobacterium marinum]|uniref:Cytosol non-specific dipeptidase n=1 Tax=Paraphotobacterium marinum TaxID=1755811 RepID=A0A220VDX0_9GAMM|nr:aminoacyl-histidine dipeptidase [Paraphotobacterium marinum]ASK78481.1 cytosol nonspecific dipeptidase [Paraphotobacterium marinum]
MNSLLNLQPQIVWDYFSQICTIPHPSGHESKLIDYILTIVAENNLEHKQDDVGNLYIKKPPTKGFYNKKTVALQAHLDMVPQKSTTSSHNFHTDKIETFVKDGWVTANETTLGADNGIGLAACLAVMTSNNIDHGPLEFLFTVNEEAGMTGAHNLNPKFLDADILLNTDSEQEGDIFVGCAGGSDCKININIERESIENNTLKFIELSLSKLKGGHSGANINDNRGNAIQLLNDFLLNNIDLFNGRIVDIKGGSLRNAIPRESSVYLGYSEEHAQLLFDCINTFRDALKLQLSQDDQEFEIHLEERPKVKSVLTKESQIKLLNLINAYPNGVQKMSSKFDGVVESSLNLGVIHSTESNIELLFLIRSLNESGIRRIKSNLSSISKLASVDAMFSGDYPGWDPDPKSKIAKIFNDTYFEIYQKEPKLMVIHAGLECGLFKKPYPNLDMISFGPTIKNPHSPGEKVEIKSVELFWQQLTAILKRIPEKL